MRRSFKPNRLAVCVIVALPLAACGDQASLTKGEDYGASPKLAEPAKTLLPTVNIAPAVGFAAGEKPKPAEGMSVTAFATGLDHPRTIHVLPNGDVLVAETNAPERPEQGKGIKRRIAEYVMGRAGARTPSANRIRLLRDADGDGVAEIRTTFLDGLNSPFGMALVGNDFYVANTDGIMRFPYNSGDTRITAAGTKLADLPGGPLNHHWTKDLIASPDGTKLYATSGSNSNVGEHGMDKEVNRAAVLEIDRQSGATRLFASGLRNPNGPAWEPQTGKLWVVVNERDEIGSDLVPDYMTSVQDGGFYGWPYSYFGQNVDERIQPPRPDLVAKAIVPDYALGNHTASLGLTFNTGDLFPADMKGGAFVGQHGSWNRKPHSGYKVIYVPFEGGKPSGPPRDILTGFLNDKQEALGRPVGVAMDARGALLVADDVGNAIWRVAPAGQEQAAR
ncbi:MAG: sorbosone dehydrogenase family protein [Rhodopseudomonas palustris]|uniref:Sorbosone dehydrogenase family protein n=1 Tax=Rhodopseudomonas palustris TaxID=1076 RepID=A0A933S2S0_RHOPL|nr:sorbosone dehydrogenase family protein [Rhodopseudomonas palustris]